MTFSFFSSGCRSPSLPSPMPNDGGTNSLPRHDGHGSLQLFDRTAPGASMTRMTKYEFPSPPRRVVRRGVARTQRGNRGARRAPRRAGEGARSKRDGRMARVSAGEGESEIETARRRGRARDSSGMRFRTPSALSFLLTLAALRPSDVDMTNATGAIGARRDWL